jgi:hypothetical protein
MNRGRARMGLGETSAGTAEVMEWGALFQQTELFAILENSVTSKLSEALHFAGLHNEPVVSAQGERRAQKGLARVMQSEIYRMRGNILRDLDRLNAADEAYRRAVASARAQGWLSRKISPLTSLLDLHLFRGQPGDPSAGLRRAMAAMPCQSGRADLVMAREVLARICSGTSLCKEPSCL